MNDTARTIRDIGNEIESLCYIEDKLRRFIKKGCTPEQRRKADEQIFLVQRRITRAVNQLKALRGERYAEQQIANRRKQFPEIAEATPVRFSGIEEATA